MAEEISVSKAWIMMDTFEKSSSVGWVSLKTAERYVV
jgi:hypothetical protein